MVENKRIAYDYLFNYFGGDKRDGKIVSGADITLNIRAYKDGKEVLFEEDKEPKVNGRYLFEVFDVGFDKDEQFVIKRNLIVDNLFRLMFGWERIEASVIQYELDVVTGTVDEQMDEVPEGIKGIPVSSPVTVTEKEFRNFLAARVDDFDITDNKQAQVPSVLFYDTPEQ